MDRSRACSARLPDGLSAGDRADGKVDADHAEPAGECGVPGGGRRSLVWAVLDLTPEGRGDWYPDNDYPGRASG
jgi:hypothetical protein